MFGKQEASKDLEEMAMERAEALLKVLNAASSMDYIGEPISQLEHALQCGKFAADSGADNEVILGALLHDIGHLLVGFESNDGPSQQRMGNLGVVNHELVGARFLLRLGFSNKLAQLVCGHVQAKRYLVWKHEHYAKKLSPASKQTLDFQGGPMGESEALAFEKSDLFSTILKLRTWDDKAKVVGLQVPGLDHYLPIILEHIKNNLKKQDA